MPWTYVNNSDSTIIEIAYTGEVTGQDLRECTSAVIALEKEKGIHRFLVDTTDMTLTASKGEIYDIPAKQYFEEDADRRGHVAVILSNSPKVKEAAEFYETTCQNRGWLARTFPERSQAIDWLKTSNDYNEPT